MAEPSDEDLLAAYAAGEPRAARDLTLRLAPRVMGQAMRMLGRQAEAEEVVQDALLRLWKTAPEWESGRAKVSTWLYKVTANLCLDRLRRARPQASLDAVAEPAAEGTDMEVRLQARARAEALRAAIARLPERQAEAVALRHLEGLANPEIAQIMGISAEAVESLTARAKRGLIAALSARKDELGIWDARD